MVRPYFVPFGATPMASRFDHAPTVAFVQNHGLSYEISMFDAESRNCNSTDA